MGWPAPVLITSPQGDAFDPRGVNRAVVRTFDLSDALVNVQMADGFKVVFAVTVKSLSGAVVPTMKLDSASAEALPLAAGEVRDGLHCPGGLFLSCDAGGGELVVEIHGR